MSKLEQRVQTAIRLPASALKLADKIAGRMSQDGFPVTRSEVLRAAVDTGLKKLDGAKKR